ncbi:phosphatase PAP2 family protein [uncultured Gemella sp.]|uniref:phosphatase PAP2 family protein n=1 Tax=uncultured Gemella sp. TaxID=254352 RepID=UPI0028D5BEE3|nr:phosphatase PAP2 family protein [uncultured Gemella sp.]
MRRLSVFTYLKILVFVALAIVAIKFPNNDFDRVLADLIEIKVLVQTAKIISLVFNDKLLLLLMILLSAFLVWIKEVKKAVFIFFTAGLGGFFLALLKYSIQRVRPLPEIHDGFSFPSGHSTFVALFFLALIFVINKKELLTVFATFAIIAVPISRMVLGAHFLSDVTAGLLLGSIIVDFMKVYYSSIYNIIMRLLGKKYE